MHRSTHLYIAHFVYKKPKTQKIWKKMQRNNGDDVEHIARTENISIFFVVFFFFNSSFSSSALFLLPLLSTFLRFFPRCIRPFEWRKKTTRKIIFIFELNSFYFPACDSFIAIILNWLNSKNVVVGHHIQRVSVSESLNKQQQQRQAMATTEAEMNE